LAAGRRGRPIAAASVATGRRRRPLAGVTMGGTWSVKLGRLPPGKSPGDVTADVQEVLDRVEGQMSTYRPASDLSRFNQYRGTDWFPVPADVAAVAAEAGGSANRPAGRST
jgi:thiamine biosynthesis lipoprotein